VSVPLIQISRGGTTITASVQDVAAASERFAEEGVLKLPAFLHPDLLDMVLELVDRADFAPRVHAGIGTELCAASGVASGTLELLMNDAVLRETIAAVTVDGHIGCFEGRLYRLVPGTDHHDSWHSDVGEDRLVAMSVNLSRGATDGGVLQIRRADSTSVLSEIANPTPGDAVIFRIHPTLRHRVSPVTGGAPRTAYAGWFRRSPEFASLPRHGAIAPLS
jgi:hypothetical protein